METLVIASNNAKKIKELRELLPEGFTVKGLKDIGFTDDIPEPHDTFAANAAEKARTVHQFSGLNCFADDSGICVPALNDAPGVYSARYAGEPCDDDRNLQKLLADMEGKTDRRAYYKAVICLVWQGKEYYFEGECHGTLATAPMGTGGFGYDPIFIPEGYTESFGTLPAEVKHGMSHRGKAVRAMIEELKRQK